MNLLKQNQKKDIRYENKVFKLYEPNEFQKSELKQIVIDNSKIEGDEIKGEYGLSVIRYILRELSNVGAEVDEMSDEELDNILDNGNRDVELLIRNIVVLLEEVSEDVMYETEKQLKAFNDILNLINSNSDINKLKTKFDKLSKKHKFGMTFDELMNSVKEKEGLENKIKETK